MAHAAYDVRLLLQLGEVKDLVQVQVISNEAGILFLCAVLDLFVLPSLCSDQLLVLTLVGLNILLFFYPYFLNI